MPDLRPVVEPSQVLDLLGRYFSTPVTDLVPIEGDVIVRVFSFHADGQDYIIRFNFDNMLQSNFPKELYLWQKLASTQIPMAPVLQVGRLGDLHFAISRKMPGRSLMQYKLREIESVLPQIVEAIDSIHHVNVSDTQGYGVFDDHGRGGAASWRDFLSRIADEELEQDYYGKWHHLFDDTFLERESFDQIYHHMLRLLEICPEDRYLVHGSLSLDNMLALDGKLTAIVKWLDARYGDFVYDIATLDYWTPTLGVSEHFRRYYQDRQITVPAYDERILCYQCFVTLDAMRFYAKSGDETRYQATTVRMLQRLRSANDNA